MEKQNYIGRKVKGFSFEDVKYVLLGWNPEMLKHVGEIGIIDFYLELGDCYSVKFQNGQWNYPASLIDQYLVHEEQDETELRDQFAMHTMNALIQKFVWKNQEDIKTITDTAYIFADSMLKSRKEVRGE